MRGKKFSQNVSKNQLDLTNQLELIINSLDDGIAVLGKENKVILANLSFLKITNLIAKEVKATKVDRLFEKIISRVKDARELMNFLQNQDREPKKVFEFHFQFTIPDYTFLKFYSAPILDQKKQSLGRLIIFRDVTREAEINRLKSEFVSVASHQLRTPLTAIRWFLEELKDERLGGLNPRQKDYLEQTYESNERMLRLVNDLLNVSRLETSRLKISPQPIQMEELIANVIDETLPLAISRNCQIKFVRPPQYLEKISLDVSLMRQVLINLISNAIKYSKEGGEKNIVEVKLETKPPHLIISVIDQGVGIPANQQAHIFDKFYRVENAKIEGSGLGLYIAKMIVELSGGTIWFESEESRGTTFCVSLPLAGSKPRKGDKILA
jgi:signal transduction histidine kinase